MASVSVEEDIGTLMVEVRRTAPSFGEITVMVHTSEGGEAMQGSGGGLNNILPTDYQEM